MATSRTSTAGRYICSACRHQLQPMTRRSFTSAAVQRQDAFSSIYPEASTNKTSSRAATARPPGVMSILSDKRNEASVIRYSSEDGDSTTPGGDELRHRLHVYASKHNTHITLTQPPKSAMLTISSSINRTTASAADRKKMVDTLISVSTGNIGFRKSGRGEYDAAFQLGAFVMKQIKEKGMLQGIGKLEVVFRGFGAGRQAVEKILLGTEGRYLRPRIIAVVDATRLKFGGSRSPRPRRLG